MISAKLEQAPPQTPYTHSNPAEVHPLQAERDKTSFKRPLAHRTVHHYRDLGSELQALKIKKVSLALLYIAAQISSLICHIAPITCLFIDRIPLLSRLKNHFWMLGNGVLGLEFLGSTISSKFIPSIEARVSKNEKLLKDTSYIYEIFEKNKPTPKKKRFYNYLNPFYVPSLVVRNRKVCQALVALDGDYATKSYTKLNKVLRTPEKPTIDLPDHFQIQASLRLQETSIFRVMMQRVVPDLLKVCHHELKTQKLIPKANLPQKVEIEEWANSVENTSQLGFFYADLDLYDHLTISKKHPLIELKTTKGHYFMSFKELYKLLNDSHEKGLSFEVMKKKFMDKLLNRPTE
ncbi:MAG: hypothetical protein ACOYL1_04870 [Chlamydiia bacterium]